MFINKDKTALFKAIIWRSSKLTAFYLLIGILLITFGYIDNIFQITKYSYLFNLIEKVGNIFIAFSIVCFIYKAISLLLTHQEQKLLENHRIASLILNSIRKGLRIIVFLIAINITINFIDPTKLYLSLANDVIKTIIIASIGWVAIQILYTFEAMIYQQTRAISRKDAKRVKGLYTKIHILRNIATVVIVLLTIATILMSFKSVHNLGVSLLASAGFLTAIIGLAAQKPLFSLFSGLQIALSQSIQIGDIVVIENESGMIEEITFTYVVLKLGDSRRMIVPLHYFIDKPFENWSHNPDSLQSSIRFNVDYLMPIPPLREHLTKILTHSKHWDGLSNKLNVSALTERSVELRIQISAASSDELSDLRAEVREKMLEFIRDNYRDYFPAFRMNKSEELGATPPLAQAIADA